MPLVSCVMPAYNYGRYIAGAIESVLAQDYGAERIELIVVDDGSTDDTPDVVAPYADRIVYIRKANGGINSAVNVALDAAGGELIAFLDADDEWPVDKISRQVAFLERHPDAGLVYADLEVIDADGCAVHPSYMRMNGVPAHSGRVLGEVLKRSFATGGAIVVRAEHLPRFHPLPVLAPWTDWWIAARVATVAPLQYQDEPVYRYRCHGANEFFGAPDGEKLMRLLRKDVPFRRWLILNTDLRQVAAVDAVEAYATLESQARTLAAGGPVTDVLPVSAADAEAAARTRADALAAYAVGDVESAARLLATALAQDPADAGARTLLGQLATQLVRDPPRPAVVEGSRGVAILGFADELVTCPELLEAYGRAVGAADDATLVIRTPAAAPEEVVARLERAVSAARLDSQDAPDMLAQPLAESQLHPGAFAAVLTRRASMPSLAGVPHVDEHSMAGLRPLIAARAAA